MVRKLSFGAFLYVLGGGYQMYPASEEFHTAVANGAHQIALMIFDSVLDDSKAVFTNDDINVSAGIEFNEYFNTEEDISIGKALSNE